MGPPASPAITIVVRSFLSRAVVVPPVVTATVTRTFCVEPAGAMVLGSNVQPMARATGATLEVRVGPVTDAHSIVVIPTLGGSVN